ncbi:MAG TPA: hypothetical protein VK658_15465, partial [Chryseolinea sp.]|nr:hypothetical protein [Chryseolinea sp.]
MRVYHRYLGFFLSGIMAVYAISGVILIFRDTEFLKYDKLIETPLAPDLPDGEIGTALRIKDFKVEKSEGNLVYFQGGAYDRSTGIAHHQIKQLPYVLDKMTKLHKANSKSRFYFLNMFFGCSLLFFVVSAFWMFLPNTPLFRKGLYFALAGLVFALLLIFV